jgi:hypothetical protein
MDLIQAGEEDGFICLDGDPLLAIVIPDKLTEKIDQLSAIYSDTDRINNPDEPDAVETCLSFDSLSKEMLANINLYYVLFENNRLDLNYFNEKTYNDRFVELTFDILRDYEWLDLKGSKKKDSSIYCFTSSQIISINGRLSIRSSHDLNYRISLEKIG